MGFAPGSVTGGSRWRWPRNLSPHSRKAPIIPSPSRGGEAEARPSRWRYVLAAVVRRVRSWLRTLREIMYGATGYEFEHHAARARADLENLFTFMIMGDLIGVPVLPPYYALRLVPYLVETVPAWRRRVLRERQPFESDASD